MQKKFFILSLLVIIISGCISSPSANPDIVFRSTNTPENPVSNIATLQPTPLAPCNEQNLSSIQSINLIKDNNIINQIQLSDLYAKRIAFSSDGERIFLNTTKGIYVVNVVNGQTICFIPDENTSFTGIALSSDDSKFVSVNRYGKITLRNSITGVITHELHNGLLQSEVTWNWVEFNSDGTLLVSAGYFQPVRVWDTTSGQIVIETVGEHAAISPNGELLAVSGVNYMQIVNIAHKVAYITRVDDSTNPYILYLLFSRDGNFLYALNVYSEINIWDVKTGKLVHTLNPCLECTGWGWEIEYPRISVSADGRRLLSADPSKVILWDTQTWEKIADESNRDNHPIVDASISPDGKTIVINYDGSLIRFLYLDP